MTNHILLAAGTIAIIGLVPYLIIKRIQRHKEAKLIDKIPIIDAPIFYKDRNYGSSEPMLSSAGNLFDFYVVTDVYCMAGIIPMLGALKKFVPMNSLFFESEEEVDKIFEGIRNNDCSRRRRTCFVLYKNKGYSFWGKIDCWNWTFSKIKFQQALKWEKALVIHWADDFFLVPRIS